MLRTSLPTGAPCSTGKMSCPSKTAFAHLPHCSPFGPGFYTASVLSVLFYVPPLPLLLHCIRVLLYVLPVLSWHVLTHVPSWPLFWLCLRSWGLFSFCAGRSLVSCFRTPLGPVVSHPKTLDEAFTHGPVEASRICSPLCLHPGPREEGHQTTGWTDPPPYNRNVSAVTLLTKLLMVLCERQFHFLYPETLRDTWLSPNEQLLNENMKFLITWGEMLHVKYF